MAIAAGTGCTRNLPQLDESSTTDDEEDADEGQGSTTDASMPADTTSEQGPEDDAQEPSSPDGSPSPEESASAGSESTTTDGEDDDSASGETLPDEDSGDSTQDDPEETTVPDDGEFDFVHALTGPRPCSEDAVDWVPVEKYREERLNIPASTVKLVERATLTGPCDATLIGPDLAITAAQCRIKPGHTKFALNRQDDGGGAPRTPVPVEVKSIVETQYSATGGYEYTIFQLTEPVGDKAGWVKMAALRLRKDEVLGMVHAPNSDSEVFSAGTVLTGGNGEFVATRSLHADTGSQGAGVVDASGFLVATHVTGSCCDGSIADCASGQELGWQSGLLAAYASSKVLRSKLAAWVVGGPGDGFTADGQRLYGIQPGGGRIWKYSGESDKWDPVGPAAENLYAGGGKLYARHEGNVSRFDPSSGKWSSVFKGLGAQDALDVDRRTGDLYRLPADRQSVQRMVDGRWEEIGGPASSIFAIYDGVLAESPNGAAVWQWNPKNNKWTEEGPGGLSFAQSLNGSIFRHDQGGVFELRAGSWSKIGGPVKGFAVGDKGTRSLFAMHPKTNELLQYDVMSKSWEKLGRPSTAIYTVGERVFAVDASSRDIVEYRPQ